MKRKKRSSKNKSQMIDPNSSNYETDLLKENLKNKYKDYEYGLSDW